MLTLPWGRERGRVGLWGIYLGGQGRTYKRMHTWRTWPGAEQWRKKGNSWWRGPHGGWTMPEQVLRADEEPEGEGWEMRLVRWTGARVNMIYVPMKHI